MIAGIDIAIFETLNALSGRSFTLDALMALAMDSAVIKGGPIAACFLFAWWHGDAGEARTRRRATLALTLLALFLIAPLMKAVSSVAPISPRPIVQAEQVYLLEGGQLREAAPVSYSPPATGLAGDIAEDARAGTVAANDLASFPSDHAALFAAFALGIAMVHRSAGLLAFAWLVFGISLPRVVSGLHWPSDMVAGAFAGCAVLVLVLIAARPLRPAIENRILPMVDRHPGWAQGAIFVLLAEAASAMTTLQRMAELAIGVLKG